MGVFKDLTGYKFGRLTVVGLSPRIRGKASKMWLCQCDCGGVTELCSTHVTQHRTLSCGCLRGERASARLKTHGQSNTRLYNIWCGMKDRCYREKNSRYKNYGGRGIVVCEQWKNSFEVFRVWAQSSGYKENLTIERRNNDDNYEPDNCIWIPLAMQTKNQRNRINKTLGGERINLSALCKKAGLNLTTVCDRIKKKGMSLEEALSFKPYERRYPKRKG